MNKYVCALLGNSTQGSLHTVESILRFPLQLGPLLDLNKPLDADRDSQEWTECAFVSGLRGRN